MDEGLKTQRDRFMALAFAVGDLLLEVDVAGRISYAIGAANRTLGADGTELIGTAFIDLFALNDQPVAAYLVSDLDQANRRGPLQLNLQPGGPRDTVLLHAFRLPGHNNTLSIAISAPEGSIARPPSEDRDSETQLLSLEAFIERIAAYLRSVGYNRETLHLTFLALPEDDGNTVEGLSSPPTLPRLAAALRTRAIADIAARLASARFVLMHTDSSPVEKIKAEVESSIKASVAATTVAIAPGIRVDEAIRVASYGVHEFASADTDHLELASIANALARRSQEIGENAAAFRQAIARNELRLVGLPVVSLDDHAVRHMELLVRHSPGNAPRPHFAFADKITDAHHLDLVMLEYALAYLASLNDRKNTIIASNMSAETLIRGQSYHHISELLADARSKPERLMIELTVCGDNINLDQLNNAITELRKFGIGFALDAFGTSPAPINHLRTLDIDYVKIAGQWVRGSAKSPRDGALVDAIAKLGADLNIGTVAMDIDSLANATNLAGRGVKYGQGRAFGHPIPIDAAKLAPLKAAG